MQPSSKQEKQGNKQYAYNMLMALVAGQVGCFSLVVIILFLLGGLWLDNFFQTTPILTFVLLFLSVPFVVIGMLWIVRKTTKQIKPLPNQQTQSSEDTDLGAKNE
jgi:F0F1-type ATP synthase assembly protein I